MTRAPRSGGRRPEVLRRPPEERERVAERIYVRLHPLMGWLALVFVIVVLSDTFVSRASPVDVVFTVAAWVIWALFATEYAVRFVIAPSKSAFLAKTWWQLIFLVLPFLAFLRIVAALRVARAARSVSAAVRTTRTAMRALSSRVAWLGAMTLVVVLLATDLLYEFGEVRPYTRALHDVALAAIGGEPITSSSGPLAQVLDVVLALYSVVVFATLAGALGAFFFERRGSPDDFGEAPPSDPQTE